MVTVIYVYAPIDRRDRERLFHLWSSRTLPIGSTFMGGDFNCTLEDEADRSYAGHNTHDSKGLRALTSRWQLADALSKNIHGLVTAADVVDFHANSHTYGYTLPDEGARRVDWTVAWAVDAISEVAVDALTLFAPLAQKLEPKAAALAWDALKTAVRRRSLTAKHERAKTLTNSYRQQLRRLQRRLQLETGPTQSPASSTDGIDTQTTRKTATFAKYSGHSADAQRAFYARFSARAPRITPARATRERQDFEGSLASRLAADWLPILQQPLPDEGAQDGFFAGLGSKPTRADLTGLAAPFTEDEVREANRGCPRGKASSPDGLPNDWYRDHEELLVPTLARLYSAWLAAATLPPSFREASVFCIPKVGVPRTGLDYRPIALLNIDYKIFSRLLLSRLKPRLVELVSPAQFGFVPGRQVHDAIDIWAAVQLEVDGAQLPATTAMVMLDFAKAGFPAASSQPLTMHLATTAAYLGDGDCSEPVDVRNGIRQGCPLAPALFIVALDCLYDAADSASDITGIALPDGTQIRLAGYADDTAAYMTHPAEIPRLLATLDAFGSASGLRVNVTKSHALAAATTGPGPAFQGCVVPVAGARDHRRQLGAMIASKQGAATVWEHAIQQIRARLALAELKTSDVHQRVQLCRAVILPKILYVARHCWPHASIVDSLQRLLKIFAWHGRLSVGTREGRAWLPAVTAVLPTADGGLGLPDVRLSLLKMATKAVTRWASAANPISRAVCKILLNAQQLRASSDIWGPCRLQRVQPALRPTLALTGLAGLRDKRTTPWEADELHLLEPLLQRCGRAAIVGRKWDVDGLVCDYTRLSDRLVELERLQHARYGRLTVGNLLSSALVGMDVLRVDGLRQLRQADLRGLAPAGATIADVLTLERVAERVVRFTCRTIRYPLGPREVARFRLLCDALVYNYPGVLRFHAPLGVLHARPATEDTWRLAHTGGGIVLRDDPVAGHRVTYGVVTARREAVRLAKRNGFAVGAFTPHPWLDPYATWAAPKPTYEGPPTAAPSVGLQEVAARARRADDAHPAIAAAMATVSWTAVERIRFSTSNQRSIYFRLKGLRLSGWDGLNHRRGCPHCPAAGAEGGHAFHIFWTCTAAQSLWAPLKKAWQALGPWATHDLGAHDDFLTAVFGLLLPQTPPRVWDTVPIADHAGATVTTIHDSLAAVWYLQVLSGLQAMWRWRHSHHDADL